MSKQKIFLTGAGGCIGHYILDHYIDRDDVELHLLLRNKNRLLFDVDQHPNIHVHIALMEDIHTLKDIIEDMDYVIHIATSWSDSEQAVFVNRDKTHELFSFCEKKVKKVVYFSTASILGPGNKPVKAALDYGYGYVRSKYLGHKALQESNTPYKDKIITLFPTLVFGGDDKHPWSHISQGLTPNSHLLKWLRFFSVGAAAHYLHAKDIAAIAVHCLENEKGGQEFVLGRPAFKANDVFKLLCDLYGYKHRPFIPVNTNIILFLAKLFRIEINPWDKYCIENPYMVYNTVDPSTFGLDCAFPSLRSLLENVKELS